MFWQLYALLTLLAAGATASVLILKESVPAMSLVSGGLWAILALNAKGIRIYHEDGSSTLLPGSTAWQFAALTLSLLMFSALVLWFLGVFPPEDPAADPPGQQATGGYFQDDI